MRIFSEPGGEGLRKMQGEGMVNSPGTVFYCGAILKRVKKTDNYNI